MLESILLSIAMLTSTGGCLEASEYPAGAVTGYVVVSDCAIPTTVEAPKARILATIATVAGGADSLRWKSGECTQAEINGDIECERNV